MRQDPEASRKRSLTTALTQLASFAPISQVQGVGLGTSAAGHPIVPERCQGSAMRVPPAITCGRMGDRR